MNWLSLAILAQAAFSFVVYEDPMDDSRTYSAEIGGGGGAKLSIECGALTDQKMAVRIDTGRPVYGSGFFPGNAEYRDRVRFDQDAPIKIGFRYRDNEIFAINKEALNFIENAKRSKSVSIEYSDWKGDSMVLTFPLFRAAESIARVETACKS